jgi:hypothetical protein
MFKGRILIYKKTILGTKIMRMRTTIMMRRRRRIGKSNWQFLGISSSLLWSRNALIKACLACYISEACFFLIFPRLILFSCLISLNLILSSLVSLYFILMQFNLLLLGPRIVSIFTYSIIVFNKSAGHFRSYICFIFFPISSYLQYFFPFNCAFLLN